VNGSTNKRALMHNYEIVLRVTNNFKLITNGYIPEISLIIRNFAPRNNRYASALCNSRKAVWFRI